MKIISKSHLSHHRDNNNPLEIKNNSNFGSCDTQIKNYINYNESVQIIPDKSSRN